MPIFRGLLLVVAVWLVFVISRQLFRSRQARTPSAPDSAVIKTRAIKTNYIETVGCETCGLRIPKAEAIGTDDRYFCCHPHRDQKIYAIGDNTE